MGGHISGTMNSFYDRSEVWVRVDSKGSEMFRVSDDLRQGCEVSPWLFYLYLKGVVREVNARVMGV